MEKNHQMMQMAFKHYKSVLAVVLGVCCLIFIGIAAALTGSMGKALILATIVLIVNIIILMSLLLPMVTVLRNYNHIMERMEQGDMDLLEHIKSYETNRLFKKLVQSISSVLNNFSQVVKGAMGTVDKIASSTAKVNQHSDKIIEGIQEINQRMEQISEGTIKQATESYTGNALMESLAEKITTTYDNCHLIKDEASQMMTLNQTGQCAIHILQERAQGVSDATQEIGHSIQLLMNKIQDITTFVDTIENISSQTNLLALNAAIEAARAGDAGNGFGVVADEIRKLADQSHESTKEIKGLVESIGIETTSVQEAMEKMKMTSSEAQQAVGEAEQVLMKIGTHIDCISEKVDRTCETVTQVNMDKQQVTHVIEEVASVTQETAAQAHESVSFVEDQVKHMQNVKEEIAALNQTVEALTEQLDHYRKKAK